MDDKLQYNILYSCTEEQKRGSEQFVSEHALTYTLSGEIYFYTNQGAQHFGAGSVGLVKRNQLAKTVKIPAQNGEPFQSINIFLDQETLRRYSTENDIRSNIGYSGDAIVKLPSNSFIKGYFNSLNPYFGQPEQLTKIMADRKTAEAIDLLLRCGGNIKEMLFDFSKPFKIDLEAFMNRNFMYNVPLIQFSKLTGRSLATFKRDFRKVFSTSPEKWLYVKRLEQAHFLISQKKQVPTAVYLEVGFENFSHFSTSFKKHFGYNPSSSF